MIYYTTCTNNGVRFIGIQKMFWRGLVHATHSVGPLPPSVFYSKEGRGGGWRWWVVDGPLTFACEIVVVMCR